WRRDHAGPLPAEEVRREWARCLCRACAIAAELGRPSIQPETQRRLHLIACVAPGDLASGRDSYRTPDEAHVAAATATPGTTDTAVSLVPAKWGGAPDQHPIATAAGAPAAPEGDPR